MRFSEPALTGMPLRVSLMMKGNTSQLQNSTADFSKPRFLRQPLQHSDIGIVLLRVGVDSGIGETAQDLTCDENDISRFQC